MTDKIQGEGAIFHIVGASRQTKVEFAGDLLFL